MPIAKRIIGFVFTLIALALLLGGWSRLTGSASNSLDSPEESGRLLGTLIPIILFGVIGVWLILNKQNET